MIPPEQEANTRKHIPLLSTPFPYIIHQGISHKGFVEQVLNWRNGIKPTPASLTRLAIPLSKIKLGTKYKWNKHNPNEKRRLIYLMPLLLPPQLQ